MPHTFFQQFPSDHPIFGGNADGVLQEFSPIICELIKRLKELQMARSQRLKFHRCFNTTNSGQTIEEKKGGIWGFRERKYLHVAVAGKSSKNLPFSLILLKDGRVLALNNHRLMHQTKKAFHEIAGHRSFFKGGRIIQMDENKSLSWQPLDSKAWLCYKRGITTEELGLLKRDEKIRCENKMKRAFEDEDLVLKKLGKTSFLSSIYREEVSQKTTEKEKLFSVQTWHLGADIEVVASPPYPKLTGSQVLIFVYSLLKEAAALHTYGLIHRDLKPDNIMAVREGECFLARLVDWEMCRALDAQDEYRSEFFSGSYRYADPAMVRLLPKKLDKPDSEKTEEVLAREKTPEGFIRTKKESGELVVAYSSAAYDRPDEKVTGAFGVVRAKKMFCFTKKSDAYAAGCVINVILKELYQQPLEPQHQSAICVFLQELTQALMHLDPQSRMSCSAAQSKMDDKYEWLKELDVFKSNQSGIRPAKP
ncbi:MAG: hypothetical protein DHS20C10_07960 [marine bacterium B5-7]|nr:MAG: hypothetical protein DHS20C10_07960 [marine bacterium B5-7]